MLSDEDFLAFSSYICFLSFFMSTACKHSNFKRFQVNAHRLWKCRADQVSWRSISRRCWSDRVHRWVQGVTVKVATRSDKSCTKMTFLDLTVEVRSILIRHYWQVTPVFLACKTVVSLQLHMRRGKVLGTRAKKRGGREKKKNKRSHSPNPSWSRFLLRFCPLPQSTSKPLLRKLLSSLPVCHSRSQLVPKLCRVTPLLKKNYW